MQKYRQLPILVIALAFFGAMQEAGAIEPAATYNGPAAEDNVKIQQVLANYTRSVSEGNRELFESQLLDLNIPFSGIPNGGKFLKPSQLASIQNYSGFRKGIFESGQKFQQRFSNIKIEQVENLAQVSLDYETALQGTPYDGKGWKVIQLIKLNGQWKIVSEFFTSYPNT